VCSEGRVAPELCACAPLPAASSVIHCSVGMGDTWPALGSLVAAALVCPSLSGCLCLVSEQSRGFTYFPFTGNDKM